MQNPQDSTFDHDATTLDAAENLALREALMMLGNVAGNLRRADVRMRVSRALDMDLSRVH